MGTMNLSTIDEQLMLDVLSVPTVSQHEHLLVEFLMDFAKKHDVEASLDDKGNVYFTKGIVADGKGYLMILKPSWYTGRKGCKHIFYHHRLHHKQDH